MSGHLREVTLNELVDGTLEAEAALELEKHLEECSRCRKEVAQLRSLVTAAAELRRGVEPPRDLWPDVSSGLSRAGGGQPAAPFPERRAAAVPSWGWLAAAAALALAVGVTITYSPWRGAGAGERVMSRGEEQAGGARSLPAARLRTPDLREAERQFAEATQQLFAALEAANGPGSPEIRALLREHLRLIDQAIAETVAALERDPQNPHLGRTLTEMYTRKMDLLQATVRLPGRA